MHRLSSLARSRPLACFFLLAYGIAWALWAPLVLSRSGVGLLPFEVGLWLTLPGSYAPLLAALCVQWLGWGNVRVVRWVPSWKGLAVGLGAGALTVALAFVVLPGLWLNRGGVSLLEWSALGLYPQGTLRALWMAGPVGEEPGWRGFALPRLQARYGPFRATLLLGLSWALWHLPLFLVPRWGGSPLWVYTLLVTGLAFIMSLGFELAGGSVLVAMVLHAMFNASSGVLGAFLARAELRDALRPDVVLALSFAAMACVITVAWALVRRRAPVAPGPDPEGGACPRPPPMERL
ncbi:MULTISPECIES: CPBP family intramembrane glutamic endopeptidase [unclassified Corallococcus]|uniref:CPBP family intramembrane glutamic endopeptidase n=1 Tax=unclassified Corallococcus TaxID=2685029 RepID=UPI001A90A8F3|nr:MULTISPECIES: type II CAAX endopeptidase family protein [unclassified Corallococcus]MBN9687452.1 CPBP family intramembrane metalloprotease [Corallococcus sp. NCSPR001]WAS88724.1 type II CAAX endopeptidase family protein [Corallococcus sp. NCRR]